MKWAASAAVLIIVAGVGLATAGQGRGHPSSLPKTLTKLCGLPDVEGAVVRFKAGDGANLVGAVAGRTGGRVGVVMANPGGGDICNWVSLGGDPKLINTLVADGDQVLLFDYRGTGHSPKASGSRSSAFDQDVLGAVAELRRRGARRIVLVGGSVGGIVSLVAATKLKPAPAAIIGLSASGISPPFTDSDGGTAAAKLHAPLLLVVARDDVLAAARSLFKASLRRTSSFLSSPEAPMRSSVSIHPVRRSALASSLSSEPTRASSARPPSSPPRSANGSARSGSSRDPAAIWRMETSSRQMTPRARRRAGGRDLSVGR